jgi:glycosyltransferase involved in cell wall biosynthesis
MADLGCKHIIIDGGSEDGTIELASGNESSSLVVEHGCSSHEAINIGVSLVDTEYFFVLNSDDEILQFGLSAMIRELKNCGDLDWIAAVCEFQIEPEDSRNFPYLKMRPEANSLDFLKVLLFESPAFNGFIFKTEFFRSLKGLDSSLEFSADREFLIRAFKQGVGLSSQKCFYRYWIHKDSRTMGGRGKNLDLIVKEHQEIVRRILVSHSDKNLLLLANKWQDFEMAREERYGNVNQMFSWVSVIKWAASNPVRAAHALDIYRIRHQLHRKYKSRQSIQWPTR